MRLKTRFAVLAVAALLTLPAPAQMQVVVSAPRGEPITLTFKPGGGRLSSITGRPYSATETLEQSLPNGTHIVMASTQISRDSVGRMRTERTEWIPQSPTGFPVIEITDPVAGYRYVLDPPHQTAHRLAVSIPVSAAPKTPRPCQMGRPTASNMHDGITAIHESLGSRMIEGVSACGDRTTMTYPAGSMFGNDRPLSLVSETWAAWDELGTIVLGTHAEPRGGTTTGGLKNVRLGEPDAALFRPPAGYHIVDETTEFAITVARPSGPSPKPAPEVTALTGMPYSAEEVLATDNTLADGTRLKHTISSTLIYRDLVGRTRKERVFEDGGTFRVFRVEIVDAAAGCRYVLDVDQKTARRSPPMRRRSRLDTPPSPSGNRIWRRCFRIWGSSKKRAICCVRRWLPMRKRSSPDTPL